MLEPSPWKCLSAPQSASAPNPLEGFDAEDEWSPSDNEEGSCSHMRVSLNADPHVFCFISSSHSGGVGIKAHHIGQVCDVHIYHSISQHTAEEALLCKVNQKCSLDDIVIWRGEFDWHMLLSGADKGALTCTLGNFENIDNAQAAQLSVQEELQLEDEDAQDITAKGTSGDPHGAQTTRLLSASHDDCVVWLQLFLD
ncbi:hypothetical protein L227DRAFT_608538 [Lentinus tigrinus ALCF2SS1-6]|uniref:Uncharacterized protein n=1 Tax=Lentinus tigrinus ALCF2SS1-6 TaxID=1328759 RepID=A0A5C2SJ12_9APHY|nr:hypothetical protein L227DRAFT_608538 [Lentinus tigrinus ALCF2SS1-6]